MSFITQPANLTTVSGTLGPTNGGTGLTSPGASGNILTSNGTAWTSAAPAGGSSFNLISTVPSNGTDNILAFTGLSGYNNYYLIFNNITDIAVYANLLIQLGTGSPVTWVTSGYLSTYSRIISGNTSSTTQQNASASGVNIAVSASTSGPVSGLNVSGEYSILDMTNGKYPHIIGSTVESVAVVPNTQSNLYTAQGMLNNTSVKTGIRIIPVGTIVVAAAGEMTASLYGISS
jgi:hypothetical protein